MCGTIFAISIIASIYLASNFQAHEMAVSALQYSQPPIRISAGNVISQSTNVTEIDQIPNIVNTVDAQGDQIVDKIDRNIVMPFANVSTYGCPYFFTKSQSINWSTFTYNSTTMSSVKMLARDHLALFQSPLSTSRAVVSRRNRKNS